MTDPMDLDDPPSYFPALADITTATHLLTSPPVALPPEIIPLILDHASYWPHTTTTCPSLPLRAFASALLFTTPALGTTHSPMHEIGFGRMRPAIPLRGPRACRMVRIVVFGRKIRMTDREQHSFATFGFAGQARVEGAVDVGLEVEVERGQEAGWGEVGQGSRSEILRRAREHREPAFGLPRVAFTYCPSEMRKAGEGRVVVLRDLGEEAFQERVVELRWDDEGAQGEIVRGMGFGDYVLLRSVCTHPWGIELWGLRIEVFFAI